MTKEAAFFLLLGLTYDLLPKKDFANQMIAKGCQVPATSLLTLREGKSRDLKTLIFAVEELVPEFEIPANILEAAKL